MSDTTGTRVRGKCEPPNLNAGNQTWILYKSSNDANHGGISPASHFILLEVGSLWWIPSEGSEREKNIPMSFWVQLTISGIP